jgi:hypothetical protein
MSTETSEQTAFDFEAAAAKVIKACEEIASIARRDLEPIWRQIAEFAEAWYNAVHEQYVAEGACYGDTPEGQRRWFEERMKAEALRAEAERIIEHQRSMAELRAKQRERRNAERTDDTC